MTEPALFDAAPYTVAAAIVEPGETLSAGRRLTLRQTADLAKGRHPLTGGRLHPSAAPAGDREAPGARCGTCHFRVVLGHHNHAYPKCLWPNVEARHIAQLPRYSNGPATDVRAYWPACTDYKLREET